MNLHVKFENIKKWYLWRPILISLAIIGVYIGVLLSTDMIEVMDLKFGDLFARMKYKISPLPKEVSNIVILSIDDRAYEWFDKKWPWDRLVYIDLVYKLSKYRPKVIGINLAFLGRSVQRQKDLLLANSFSEVGNVVIASYFDEDGWYYPPDEIFQDVVAGYGFTNRPLDRDSVIRTGRLFARAITDEIMAYSFELRLLEEFMGIKLKDVNFHNKRLVLTFENPETAEIKKMILPVNYDGTARMSFNTLPKDYSTIPIIEVLNGEVSPDLIEGKIVLIGMTSRVFQDIYYTPLGPMPGTIVVANGFTSLIRSSFIKSIPLALDYVLLVFLGIFIGIITYRHPFLKPIIWLVSLLLVFFICSLVLTFLNLSWDFFSTPFILCAIFGTINLYKYIKLFIEGIIIKRMVITDSLTSLATRRYFQLRLQNDLKNAIKDREDLGLVIFDVDNFNSLTASFGNEQVDEIIKELAKIIQRNSRKSRGADFLGRCGEREVCAILHKTPLKGIQIYVNRIQRIVSETRFLPEKKARVALTVGMAAYPLIQTASADVFFKCAESALRRGEKEGIKVSIYQEGKDQVSFEGYEITNSHADVDLNYIVADLEERNKQLIIAIRNLRKAHEDIIKAERLGAMGKITAQVHHELNNPLHNLRNCLATLNGMQIENAEMKEILHLSLKEVDRMVQLSYNLRDFYKPVKGLPAEVDIHEVLDEMLKMSEKRLMNNNIELKKEYGEGVSKIIGFVEEIKQVFLNLIINAADAMPTGGELAVKTCLADSMVEVHFKDTGCGIPKENTEKIFQPFFTTKDEAAGTGLGLYAVSQIVKRHGGRIDVKSKVGKGTTFILAFPLTPSF